MSRSLATERQLEEESSDQVVGGVIDMRIHLAGILQPIMANYHLAGQTNRGHDISRTPEHSQAQRRLDPYLTIRSFGYFIGFFC